MDQFFGDDHGSPYSINMNVFLPDIAYLRTGMCRPARPSVPNQIKTEPVSAPFSHPECPVSSTGPVSSALPDFTSIFNSNSTSGSEINAMDDNSGVFVKQEMQGFDIPQDGPLFQLLSSELDVPHQGDSHSHPHAHSVPSLMPTFHNLHLATQQTVAKAYCGMSGYPLGPGHFVHPQGQAHSQLKMPYLPPSPPTSEPGSPDRQKEMLHNLTPPPPLRCHYCLQNGCPCAQSPNTHLDTSSGHHWVHACPLHPKNEPRPREKTDTPLWFPR